MKLKRYRHFLYLFIFYFATLIIKEAIEISDVITVNHIVVEVPMAELPLFTLFGST